MIYSGRGNKRVQSREKNKKMLKNVKKRIFENILNIHIYVLRDLVKKIISICCFSDFGENLNSMRLGILFC